MTPLQVRHSRPPNRAIWLGGLALLTAAGIGVGVLLYEKKAHAKTAARGASWVRVSTVNSNTVYRVSRPAGSTPPLKTSYGAQRPADWPADDTSTDTREYGLISYGAVDADGKPVQTNGDKPADIWGDDAASWLFWKQG